MKMLKYGVIVIETTLYLPEKQKFKNLLVFTRPSTKNEIFLYSYEGDFSLLQRKEKKLVQSFGFMFRYIDDVLTLNNSEFGDYVDLIYPI